MSTIERMYANAIAGGLPAWARRPGGTGSAKPGIIEAARDFTQRPLAFTAGSSDPLLVGLLSLFQNESSLTLGLPAGTFHLRPGSSSPKISAWGFHQFNQGAWNRDVMRNARVVSFASLPVISSDDSHRSYPWGFYEPFPSTSRPPLNHPGRPYTVEQELRGAVGFYSGLFDAMTRTGVDPWLAARLLHVYHGSPGVEYRQCMRALARGRVSAEEQYRLYLAHVSTHRVAKINARFVRADGGRRFANA